MRLDEVSDSRKVVIDKRWAGRIRLKHDDSYKDTQGRERENPLQGRSGWRYGQMTPAKTGHSPRLRKNTSKSGNPNDLIVKYTTRINAGKLTSSLSGSGRSDTKTTSDWRREHQYNKRKLWNGETWSMLEKRESKNYRKRSLGNKGCRTAEQKYKMKEWTISLQQKNNLQHIEKLDENVSQQIKMISGSYKMKPTLKRTLRDSKNHEM